MKPILILYTKIAKESVNALHKELQKIFEVEIENPYETKNRHFSNKNYSFIFNFGFSKKTTGVKKLNKSNEVEISLDKELTFKALKENKINSPSITKDFQEASSWIKQGRIVVVRNETKGNNSKGISFCSTQKELNKYKKAPLYTRYIHFDSEYRINLWRGEILSVYKKVLIQKNTAFKFILQKTYNPKFIDLAKNIYKAIPLDFVGVDLIVTAKNNIFVLETNSAPILFPTTIKKLVEKIKLYANSL